MYLEIYTGCMGSGKSATLINVLERISIYKCDVYTFGNQPFIHSRNGERIKAIPIKDLDNLGSNKCVLIDECQFHYWTWVEWEKLIDRYNHIYLAGLDIMQDPIRHEFYKSDFVGSFFQQVFPMNVSFNRLVGKCDITGHENATHSFRFRDAKDVRDRNNYVSLSKNEAEKCRLFTKDEYFDYKKRYNNSKVNE